MTEEWKLTREEWYLWIENLTKLQNKVVELVWEVESLKQELEKKNTKK